MNRAQSQERGACRTSETTPSSTSNPPITSPTFGVSLISTPSRCKPNSKINAPAIGAKTPRFCRKNDPTALAEAPNEMNTTENPATNASDDRNNSAVRHFPPLRNCSMPIPDSMEMYPGTSGNTHGDRKETNPARNAPAKRYVAH